MDGQLKKGVLETCILYIVSQGDQYGYEIIRIVLNAFPDVLNSTVYAILRRLSNAGYVSSYESESSSGQTRKYYKLNQKGKDYLQTQLDSLRFLRDAMDKIGI